MFNNKSILITGGSGLFGRCFIETILRDYPEVKKIIIYSRDVQKQDEILALYPKKQFPQLRYFIGDVRDKERLIRACGGVDIIVHAATIASIEAAEYNPGECIKTNIIGAENVINAALKNNVHDVVALSSDKACAPSNLYGATQLVSDKLFVAANNLTGLNDIKFSVVRYGNVMGSKGSVIPLFIARKKLGGRSLPITDKRMTRFIISNQEVVSAVEYALENHMGGEIFIPKVSSYKVTDLATAIAPEMEQVEIGRRPGEKIDEKLISSADSQATLDLGKYYAILPSMVYTGHRLLEDYKVHYNAVLVPEGFHYSSNDNPVFETVNSLRDKIRMYIDASIKF
ncbi:UDP-N-acetylglucosamine 4,6-dehydratase (inverting) [Parabacteroides distasonis]|jgi:UDP-N-acetylglucosamine 4,6-dehydratase|uniref:UDP-N-acetylglucosamine 4,6-dehydratase (inverting) n=1 Tax=Parabacteroides distasonis TaxID=823 RepID=UPI00189803ED|nr:UDP-N-acetylglucosamine 4,6-dehydratase (inverting) [Parabacteroides distasonis]MDB8998156.1 UDP-N-acetylglucosamine 4,6-dehydratase (inverting) [Parabacteroides distasonis]MDB9072739.1 UDP-N-acetylglucosamine 4,6-dehydratase (inverting) [Parabacteroides distasonis]